MKIFEFHFNPGKQNDLVFDSFCYESNSSKEQKLGNLYIVGEIRNVLPQNSRLVHNLALLLKREYFFGSSSEQGIKRALKKANDFLSDRAKTGNVSWLGNFSLAAVSLHNFNINFSKNGKIKMLLLRPGHIIDIGRNFEIEEFEPYPLKIFTNIVNGKFLENDKVLLLTEQVFQSFLKTGFLEVLSKTNDLKDLKNLFKNREKEFSEISGICFLIVLSKENAPKSALVLNKATPSLSLKEISGPLLKVFFKKPFKNISLNFNFFKVKMPKVKINKFRAPVFKIPKIPKIPSLNFRAPFLSIKTKRNLALISAFVLLAAVGFFYSKKEAEMKLIDYRNQIIALQEKAVRAEAYLVLEQESKADSLFKETYNEILPLSVASSPVQEEAKVLKDLVEKNLIKLNKVQIIAEPVTVFDFGKTGFSPQRIAFFNNSLYFFTPFQKGIANIFNNNIEKTGEESFYSAAPVSDGLALFSRPNKIFIFNNQQIVKTIVLEKPNQEDFVSFAAFNDNLYFLEKDTGRIVKYQQPFADNAGNPSYWINLKEKKALGAESLKVTGSAYVLAKDNSIWKYSQGSLEKVITPSFFPFPKSLARMVHSPAFAGFALLEPTQSRIILIDDNGFLVRQFKSEKFVNLKDAVFSEDARFLYILSGSQVYQISL